MMGWLLNSFKSRAKGSMVEKITVTVTCIYRRHHLQAMGETKTFIGIYVGEPSETSVSERWCEIDCVHPQCVATQGRIKDLRGRCCLESVELLAM